ncbi:probable fructose-2,6-bisphosphatase TIGAR A isoform X2 [Phyllopteryx taeniolatus]|uniref:probable fructose-2,6-bisphosphatase TIGAR A isoform X2 n=1 Tax=Phyllopteryx taeniolatus TaxID=161469 RepID=UPI002AD36E6C|nr:probable fructose-2,6-bisphosphatase TIGAR A isoform X2 [Phyllopteryx taeniolatus]
MERKRKKKRGFYRNGGKTVALQNGLASILTPVCSTLGLPGSPGVHLCACSCETPSQGVQSSSHWMRKACCLVDGLQEMKSLMLGLTFVRHGETQFNKEGLLQGQAIDCPLSEVGLQQAEAAGRYLTDVKFSNLFVSDMLRARQVKQRVKEFWLKMLRQVWCEHRGDNERSSAPYVAGEEADDLAVHALVVSHGAYLCVTMRFLVDDLHCPVPEGCSRARMFSLSPNAGVSRFVLTLTQEDEAFKVSHIQCLFVNKGDHVAT